ncbi:hypothetical protein BJF78_14620 [Pseudonocardia sp. CNS-139]|nr:hypothetical protein BJF78_14620 [Pseudonocardia sp. CNS-139]
MRMLVGAAVAAIGMLAVGCGRVPDGRFADPRVTALVAAAADGDDARVAELHAAGADLDARGIHGRTPLMVLVLAGADNGVRALLAAGADPAAGDDDGRTILHHAAAEPTTSMLAELLDLGVDPSLRNTVTGAGPLHEALLSERPDAVRMLIERGTDVDLADRTGHTPLHDAAAINQTEAVLALLAAGADPTARTVNGATFQRHLFMTPEEILLPEVQRDRRTIRRWLEERGVPVEHG